MSDRNPDAALFISILAMTACAGGAAPVVAQETEIGFETKLDRMPGDFSRPKATKFQIDLSHSFAGGLILGGSFVPSIAGGDGRATYNLETTLGYKWQLNDAFSVKGSVGVGERFQPAADGGRFPYYALRIGADVKLNADWTWNIVTYRFRDAFDTRHGYNTPEVATRITFRIDDRHSVSGGYYHDWKEGRPDGQGISVGYKYRF